MKKKIPQKVRDAVLNEFNHKCAICGDIKPHLHHINENSWDSIPENLIPLCPNCHLSDQHSPTKSISPELLRVFREFKDPIILSSQFKPLFDRYYRLYCIHHDQPGEIGHAIDDLTKFVSALKMGNYYSQVVRSESEYKACYINYNEFVINGEFDHEAHSQFCLKMQISMIYSSKVPVLKYIVELARYQDWRLESRNA